MICEVATLAASNVRTIAAAVAFLLLLACEREAPPPPANSDPRDPTSISKGHQLRRLTVFRDGWNPGNEASVVEPQKAARLYELLAGNEQVLYTCGFHWSFAFEYADGMVEVQQFNHECESFRSDHDEIWSTMIALTKEAAQRPTHATYLVRLNGNGKTAAAAERMRALGYGVVSSSDGALVVAVPAPPPGDILERLRAATPDVSTVEEFNKRDDAA